VGNGQGKELLPEYQQVFEEALVVLGLCMFGDLG
jgi:hypothetical protein